VILSLTRSTAYENEVSPDGFRTDVNR
jgi:hypothetical protein